MMHTLTAPLGWYQGPVALFVQTLGRRTFFSPCFPTVSVTVFGINFPPACWIGRDLFPNAVFGHEFLVEANINNGTKVTKQGDEMSGGEVKMFLSN